MHKKLSTKYRLVRLAWYFVVTAIMVVGSAGLFQAWAQSGGVAPGETGQTNPKTRQNTVSAIVPDNGPPSPPILISPNNGAYVTTSTPSFTWQASTDPSGISHYRLSLDGNTLFDNIPTSATSNANYTLTYNALNQEYTLTPVAGLSEGNHTWKITAYDTTNNSTDSATWSFTIDTQAPVFVVTQIGTANVSISAQDLSTVPSSPIQLTANQPLLRATGEVNSNVNVTLIIPGDPTQNFPNVVIDGSGNWSLQLGTLPYDTIMTLNFVITDQAGNVSVLSNVQFVIPTPVIVFPPVSPSPSPTPEPSPGASPEPSAEPTASPSPAPSPLIVIPVIPPQDIAFEIIQETSELLAPLAIVTSVIPETIREGLRETTRVLAPVSAAVVASALPIATSVAVASQFGGGLSFDLLFKILQALGFIPVGKPQGLVFDSQTDEPVPFALLTITSQDDNHTINETVVSDVSGVYKGFKLPVGKYVLTVSHQDFRFPTQLPRPPYLQIKDFYKGEVFVVNSEKQEQLFLIPVDSLNPQHQSSFGIKVRLFFARLSRQSTAIILPLFLISGLITLLYPTIWNWLIFAFYCVMLAFRAREWFKVPLITGNIIDDQGQPVHHAVIRLAIPETNELSRVVTSDDKGYFALYAPQGNYQLSITKTGLIWYDEAAPLSFYEIRPETSHVNIVVTMKAVATMYDELFS